MSDKTFAEKLHQALLDVEDPKFDSTGQVGTRRYPYASLKECMRVVKAACNPLGLTPSFTAHEEPLDHWTISTLVSDGKESAELFPVPVDLSKDMQSRGSAITYAKRYSLVGAFALNADSDDDGAACKPADKPKQKPAQKAQKAPQPKQKPKDAPEMAIAKKRLWDAVQRYAELEGKDPNEVAKESKELLKGGTVGDYMKLAEQYEDACIAKTEQPQ